MQFLATIIASGYQENGQGNCVTCMDMFKECAGGRGGGGVDKKKCIHTPILRMD